MNINIHEHIATAAGVTITAAPENLVTVKGPKGEVKRSFFDPKIQITGADGGLDLKSQRATRKEKTRLYSYAAHIKNMIQGVQIPHEYKMKVCSGHFPINVAISGSALSVKNFLGEKTPRTTTVPAGVTVKVEGDKITISSPDIELAGQTASSFETVCRITNRDRRIFQDGIYIIKKAGEE
ncbi:MAG: 50S ribosomal protein L6 [Nanoarchaeota archaeon]